MSINLKSRKAIFFEDIQFFHYLFVKFYLSQGYEVYIFDFKRDLKKYKWLRTLIINGVIHRIEIQPNTRQHGEAIDVTQEIHQYFRNNRLSEISVNLYQGDDIDINFKKLLVDEVFKCVYIDDYLAKTQKCFGNGQRPYLISVNYKIYSSLIKQFSKIYLKSFDKFKVPLWHLLSIPIILLFEKSKSYFGLIVYILAKSFFISLGKLFKKKISPQHFKYAVGIDMFDLHGVLTNERSASFLLDDGKINKKNTVFVVNCPLDSKQSSYYKENGYNFIETERVNRLFELAKFNYSGIPFKILFKIIVSIFEAWNLPPSFFKAFFINLRIFLKWSIVLQNIKIENYIYSNNENANQSAINILIAGYGAESWSHAFSLGGGYFLSRDGDFKDCRNIIWSFLYIGHFVGMNQDVIDFYKLHYQKVKEYHVVGCFYSEMIYKKNNIGERNEFLENTFKIKILEKPKVITFFDTTFDDSSEMLTNYEDCLSFYKDIKKVLDLKKDILVFIKPSKRFVHLASSGARRFFVTNVKEILKLWETLGSHPRVFYKKIPKDADYLLDFELNNFFIASSDLVITHCMSSPTAEALGARKKAFWYESGDKHRGMIYDQIPGLCAHGFNELIERIDELLYKTSDDEYNEYLDRYIKRKIESHLDGLAVTRFRQLLINRG